MSWRTVVISSRCKLDLKMGYMVVRGEETRRIFLDEIATLIIENPAISMTGCLLEALTEKKIKVIFCDAQRNPQAELVPLYGSHDSSRKLRAQIAWTSELKGSVWTRIVGEKIHNQASFLAECGKREACELLCSYIQQLEFADETNREGHAAKVYFNALFGMEFSRQNDCPINAALNYGYSLLLSSFNREISACGYLTQLGLFHDNIFNHFNLSSDLMEPFRVLVDRQVYDMMPAEFGKKEKLAVLDILNDTVSINETEQTVRNAVGIYVRSVFTALNDGDVSAIRFYATA